ncbi:hypothetical protein ROZALSC1DRAFT_31233 [Rozella allomycis CSF55]|uniref:NAA35-like N-terminal domain-containing protein n=1 Tax=Rozella allomycis (strain CSF55) TaxID=988480 RepID=A0A075AVK6_ROZAC|nr:hypothetical protein O9G_000545 [Rozella allomycis CSF55]RKP16908.1 hypothetical protein ROZALSC1DRAFT_31233 [Rozella allomycis CSF55]|eukprot:EPZ34358.1 hypothetical protein O9G_000545 [Rozella allomycis CSF55]
MDSGLMTPGYRKALEKHQKFVKELSQGYLSIDDSLLCSIFQKLVNIEMTWLKGYSWAQTYLTCFCMYYPLDILNQCFNAYITSMFCASYAIVDILNFARIRYVMVYDKN